MKPMQAHTDAEMIDMLDTLGYLRNRNEIWTMVPKDFDLDAAPALSGLHFECCKPGQSPFEIVSGAVIQPLADEGYVKPVIRPDGNNANNQFLYIELDAKGEQWYLHEALRWEGSLHHKLAPLMPDTDNNSLGASGGSASRN